jgi:hypothetical protein
MPRPSVAAAAIIAGRNVLKDSNSPVVSILSLASVREVKTAVLSCVILWVKI